jgi:hypothetical protein
MEKYLVWFEFGHFAAVLEADGFNHHNVGDMESLVDVRAVSFELPVELDLVESFQGIDAGGFGGLEQFDHFSGKHLVFIL